MQGREEQLGTLVVRRAEGATKDEFFYEAKWRTADRRQVKRRLGRAWLEAGADGQPRPRRGRVPDGYLDERRAYARMHEAMAEHAEDRDALALAAAERERRKHTFRALAHQWLDHVEHVKNVKPSTLRDYRSLLAEPNGDGLRGRKLRGRIMAALGDTPAHEVTVAQVEALLRAVSGEGVSARTVNKHRETLRTIFNYGMSRVSGFNLTLNPAAETPLRKQDPPGRLEVFDVDQIEALARSAASGSWRTDRDNQSSATTRADRQAEDQQLAELLRVACYTGLRRGELVTLRWGDVRWQERVLVVERSLSGNVETLTKSRRARYVPLADQPLAALERLSRRENFTGADDYVFAGLAGDRLDPSALRRRYLGARDAAGLPPLRFHDLRHTAGSLLVRVIDPASVKDILGHADLKTTERYLHAQRASILADAATRAFEMHRPAEERVKRDVREELASMLNQLADEDVRQLLAARSDSR